MKKIFTFIVAVLLLFVSCIQTEDLSMNLNVNGQEIVFNVSTGISTRAIINDTKLHDNFGVYGYVAPGAFVPTGGYLMKNAEYDSLGNAVSGPYFWPKSDNNTGIDFYFTAYSQYDTNVDWKDDTLRVTLPKLIQDVINNPDSIDDFVFAQTYVDHHQNATQVHERVNLAFGHILSRITFKGKVNNPFIKWVKVKQISFGEYRDSIPGIAAIPEVPYQPAVYDTTDIYMNLRRGTNVDGSPTKTSVNGAAYVDNYEIPAALVAEIKSYYSINNGTASDYDLHMGASVWPSAEIRQLRVVKEIPAAYKRYYGEVAFFDALKYLKDNGYDMAPRTNGGKPAIFDLPIIDLFVNGSAYTIVGFSYSIINVYDANVGGNVPALNYVIEEVSPEVPYQAGVDAVPGTPAMGSDGLFTEGTFVIRTDTISAYALDTIGAVKDTTLNYYNGIVDTIFNNDVYEVLGDAVVIPQAVPENLTVVFDMCIGNNDADTIIFTDRKITRVINTGVDANNKLYTDTFKVGYKYVYNFKFEGDTVNINIIVNQWNHDVDAYDVWDF